MEPLHGGHPVVPRWYTCRVTPRHFAFVTIGYPPFVGGAQIYVKQLAESLVADGHAVTVFTTDAAEVERIWDADKRVLPTGEEDQTGVRVRRLPLNHLPIAPYSHFVLRRATVALAAVPWMPERALAAMARFTPWVPGLRHALAVCSPRPDLVHSFAIPFESMLCEADAYAAKQGVPHMVTPFLHVDAAGYTMPHQVGLLRRSAAVVALTDIERDYLTGLGIERVREIPAAIPAPVCKPAPVPEARSILFLGAVTRDKGAVHLVEAARSLWQEGVEFKLTLAGDIGEAFLRYHQRLPERGQVKVPGIVSEECKAELLRECTALALPSRVDAFGIVLLEAWAQGRPVIGARAGGIPAVVDEGENGLLVPFGDVSALAAAIRRLVTRPGEAARMGWNGHKKLLERYTWEKVYPQLLAVYETVLAA